MQDQSPKRKLNPAVIMLLSGTAVIAAGIVFMAFQKGLVLFDKLEMTQPQPTNTMLEAPKEVADTLKNQNILGELKQFEIDGSNFNFTPSEIVVNSGDTVQINFVNSQGMHNLTIEGINISTKILKQGTSEQITFIAPKKGTYNFYCNVGNHKAMGMVGTIIVN